MSMYSCTTIELWFEKSCKNTGATDAKIYFFTIRCLNSE